MRDDGEGAAAGDRLLDGRGHGAAVPEQWPSGKRARYRGRVSRRVVLGSAALLLAALVLWAARWALLRFREPGAEQLQLPLRGGGVSLSWAPPPANDSGSAADEPRDFL